MANRSEAGSAGRPPGLEELERRLLQSKVWMLGFAVPASLLAILAARAGDGRMVAGLWVVAGLTSLGTLVEYRRHRRTLEEMLRAVARGSVAMRDAQVATPGKDENGQVEPHVFRDRLRLRVLTILLAMYLLFASLALFGGVLVALDPGPAPPVSEYLVVIVPAALLGLAYIGARRMRVEADLEGLTLFGFFTTRRIAWSRIAGAQIVGDGLVLLLDDGRTVMSRSVGYTPHHEQAGQLLELIGERAAGPLE